MVNISSQLISTKAKHDYRKQLYKIETPPSASSDDSESGAERLTKQNSELNNKLTDSSLMKLTSTVKSSSSTMVIARENSKSMQNISCQKYSALNATRNDDRIPKMSPGSRRIMGCDVVSIKSCSSSSSSKRVSSHVTTHSASKQLIENSSLNFLGDYDHDFKDKSTESGKIETMSSADMRLEKKYSATDLELDEGGYEIVYDSKIDDAIRVQSLSSSNIDSNSSSANAKNDSIAK
jgi:hypothetical protein